MFPGEIDLEKAEKHTPSAIYVSLCVGVHTGRDRYNTHVTPFAKSNPFGISLAT